MSEKRLDRLMPALAAKERAILVLEALRRGEQPDPRIVYSTPPASANEFNRLLGLINAVNVELAVGLVVLREQLKQTSIKMAWLQSVRLFSLDLTAMAAYIAMETDEPITHSDWLKRRDELGKDADDLHVIVEHLVYDSPWQPSDLDEDGEPSDAAVEARCEEVEAVLREAIAAGDLPAVGRGKRKVRWNDLAAWTGTEMPVFPDWGRAYTVHPDSETDAVARSLWHRRLVEGVFDDAPKRTELPLGVEELEVEPERLEPSFANLPRVLILAIRRELFARAAELAAVEQVVQAIADTELEGHSPLDHSGQAIIDEAAALLEEIRTALSDYIGEITLPPASEDDIALVWALVNKAAA